MNAAPRSVFDILGLGVREDPISSLIGNAFNADEQVRRNLLELFGWDETSTDWRAFVRRRVGNRGIPDITFVSASGQWRFLELKVTAGEGQDQTERYADAVARDIPRLSGKFEPSDHAQGAGVNDHVFVTLGENALPGSEQFNGASLHSLLEKLVDKIDDSTDTRRLLIDLQQRVAEADHAKVNASTKLADLMPGDSNTNGLITPQWQCDRALQCIGGLIEKDDGLEFVNVGTFTSARGGGDVQMQLLRAPVPWLISDFVRIDDANTIALRVNFKVQAKYGDSPDRRYRVELEAVGDHYERDEKREALSKPRCKHLVEQLRNPLAFDQFVKQRDEFHARVSEQLERPWRPGRKNKWRNQCATLALAVGDDDTVQDLQDAVSCALTQLQPVVDELMIELG